MKTPEQEIKDMNRKDLEHFCRRVCECFYMGGEGWDDCREWNVHDVVHQIPAQVMDAIRGATIKTGRAERLAKAIEDRYNTQCGDHRNHLTREYIVRAVRSAIVDVA